MPMKIGREYARLIRPTRKHAPTEYNLRYKRWPQHAGEVPKPVSAQNKRGKIVKAGRLWSSNNPRKPETKTSATTAYPQQTTDETSGKAATCGTQSFISRFSSGALVDELNTGDLNAALLATPMQLHTRPHAPTPRRALEHGGETGLGQSKSLESDGFRHVKTSPNISVPPRPKKAWMTKEEEEKYQSTLQGDICDKLRHLNVYKSIDSLQSLSCISRKSKGTDKENNKIASGKNKSPGPKTQDSPRGTISPREQQPTPSRRNSYASLPPETKAISSVDSNRGWRYYFPEDDRDVPRLKSGVKVLDKSPEFNIFKKKKLTLGDGIDEDSLRKIYTEATDDEIRRLNRTFKGILRGTNSGERVVRKQYTTANTELPPDTSEKMLTKKDFDDIRLAAFKASQKVASGLHKDVWTTSYTKDFCKKWSKKDLVDMTSKNYATKNEPDMTVKEHFKSKELIEKVEGGENSVDGCNSDDEEKSGKEESDDEISRNTSTRMRKLESVVTETTKSKEISDMSKQSSVTANKVLEEAHDIEEKEFKSIFGEDGKPKMKFETTFAQTYKAIPCQKPEEPVWANKTVVSLGSGHWNVLWDHYDGWQLEGDAGKNVRDMIPKKDERRKYKIKIYEQGEPCPSKSPIDENAIMGKYGGQGGTRKTHVNYMTEYMRKFTRMPLPRKKVRI